jgi:hypothetical protein
MVDLMAYGKAAGQPMNFNWQIARKIDRLDLGSFAAVEFFYRNAIIFGLVRAKDPKDDDETETAAGEKKISDLVSSVDKRINDLMGYDTTAILLGHSQLKEVKEFQRETMSAWYEIGEIVERCHFCDQVLHQIQEAP